MSEVVKLWKNQKIAIHCRAGRAHGLPVHFFAMAARGQLGPMADAGRREKSVSCGTNAHGSAAGPHRGEKLEGAGEKILKTLLTNSLFGCMVSYTSNEQLNRTGSIQKGGCMVEREFQ